MSHANRKAPAVFFYIGWVGIVIFLFASAVPGARGGSVADGTPTATQNFSHSDRSGVAVSSPGNSQQDFLPDKQFLIESQRANVIAKNAGNRQTDLALYWNNMTDGCVRAFAFDGDSTDEMRNADATAKNVRYRHYRYLRFYHLKYDYNRCAVFNGKSSKVNIGSAADISNLRNFTISAWVYVANGGEGDRGRIYSKYVDSRNGVWLCVRDETNGKVNLHGRVGCAETAAQEKSTLALSLREWHHVAMTWNNSSKRIDLYMDGAAASSDMAYPICGVGKQGNDSRADGIIGNDVTGSSTFDGYIADFFLYKKVLTTAQIEWLADKGEFQVTPNLGAMGKYGNFPPGQMQSPVYAVEDSEGYIWVSEFGTPRVSKLNHAGEVVRTLGGERGAGDGEFYGPWGLALDKEDNLYVVDSGNDRIQVFDKEGNFLRKWGGAGSADGQFNFPICVAVHGDSAYVADRGNRRIQKFTREGAFITKWGSPGKGDATRRNLQFYKLEGVACDAKGNLWVLDAGLGHDKNWLKQFAPNGRFLRTINSEDHSCHGLSVSGEEIFVGDGGDMCSPFFCKYSIRSGKRTGYWGTLGSDKDKVLAGWGVHVTPRGTVLTTDWFGCKIQEWTKKGGFIRCIPATSLHDNGYSIRCKNTSSSPRQFYQTRTLKAEEYVVCFMAYTDGSPVTSADVLPFAGVAFTNEISEFHYGRGSGGAYLCWGTFTATAEPWNVGAEVKSGKVVHIALPTCCPRWKSASDQHLASPPSIGPFPVTPATTVE